MKAAISWEAPLQPNGFILAYNLSIGVIGQAKTPFVFNETTFSFSFQVPTRCRQYAAVISAYTTVGPGPPNEKNFTATAPGIVAF